MKDFSISELAKTHGAENIRFFFAARPMRQIGFLSFTTSTDEQTVVEAKAIESFNRYLVDDYKMLLKPLDENYAHENFYISDFESLCEKVPEKFYVMVGQEKIEV